jgi:hypothetical protein
MSFIQDAGIPQTIVTDNAPEETRGAWEATCKKYRVKQATTVPYSPWANLAEAAIRELKVGMRRAMRRSAAPKRLWCYCGQWVAAIRRLTASQIPQLQGRVPAESVQGSTPDISQYAQFGWYEPVYYYDPQARFPSERKRLVRWIGVAEVSTEVMAFYILADTGKVVVRKDVWALSDDECGTTVVQEELAELKRKINSKLGDGIKDSALDPTIVDGVSPEIPDFIFEDEDEELVELQEPGARRPNADVFTPATYDQYLTKKVLLSQGGEKHVATVTGRKRDHNGDPIGTRHPNPLLDTREYEVEFQDGSRDSVSANTVAENLFAQVDAEGRCHVILKEIVDHRTTGHALSKDDGFEVDRHGRKQPKMTTRGWEIQVEWRDGTTSWVRLADLKESNPVELSEYAVANKLAEEPAFAWWVRDVLRRRDRIIKKVKSRYWERSHKFGIELPKSVKQALQTDQRTGTDVMRKAIEAEMRTVEPAFQFVEDNVVPAFYKRIDCHSHDLRSEDGPATKSALCGRETPDGSSERIDIFQCGVER